MQYIKIPYVDKPVSRILYGTASPPFLVGQDGHELLDSIVALGINTLDMARNYMCSEQSVGRWLEARGNRDDLVLLSKCGHPSMFGRKRINEADMRKDFAKTTGFLHTDYIDIYLLHVLSYDAMDNEEIVGAEMIPDLASPSLEENVISREVKDRLHHAVEALPRGERELIHAIYFEGKSEREYAKQQGCSQNKIYKRRIKILSKLKMFLDIIGSF